VEHDHLRRAPRLAARLDRSRGRVCAAHERDGAGGVAALRELLLGRAEVREVDAGAGAAAEDDALAADPVEDRLHRVVDREDEAVMDGDVVREVLARLGLDVVDLLDAERLDRDDLFLAKVAALLQPAERQRLKELGLLGITDESNELGEAGALGADADLDLVEVEPIVALLLLANAPRVDAEDVQQ